MKDKRRMMLIVTIVERGHGRSVTKLYTGCRVITHLRFGAAGTATSEILDILGLGASDKNVIVSTAPYDTVSALFDRLENGAAEKLGRGIAFTVPLTAMSSLLAAMIEFKTKPEQNTEEAPMENAKNSLLLLTVNQGFADEVMETARKQGARGGTVLRGRWVGEENFEEIYGHPTEKEVIAIVAPKEQAEAILEAVNEKHGLPTPAGAVVCAVGIDRLTRFS